MSIHSQIAQINALGYGLTLGIQTRIDSRAQALAAAAHVGNIHINRNMIGAVVGVEPFGGEGLSGTGPKARGPHYLYRFCAEQMVTVNTTAAGGGMRRCWLACIEARADLEFLSFQTVAFPIRRNSLVLPVVGACKRMDALPLHAPLLAVDVPVC